MKMINARKRTKSNMQKVLVLKIVQLSGAISG